MIKNNHQLDSIINILKKKSKFSEIRNQHSSAILYKNQILTIGINYFVNEIHPKSTVHAEVDALFKYKNINKRKLNDKCIDIIVIRTNKNMKLINSKPCLNCLNIIKKFKINKIYYSDENGNINIL